ncbi:peptidase U32 family protein [Spirochaeta dissipatitropha]
MMKSSGPELLAPAGSLQSALYAFSAGADAVYFGLNQFSARASATNFSREDARRLKSSAQKQNRRIYAAVNTLIMDNEIPDLLETAAFLDYLEVDAVIIQDWGAASLLRSEFPQLELHASTQTAIHDLSGLQWAHECGISRCVIPRELSAAEIAYLMQNLPGRMEIEAFIHGAQCFGFSGLCLASGIQLKRSANRGACAQICRTWFMDNNGRQFYPFSANDKSAGDLIHEIIRTGIHSLKIEGRMKSPRYVRDTTAWYRSLIDSCMQDSTNIIPESGESLRSIFARNWTQGFWNNKRGSNMLNQEYPGATGSYIGKVTASDSDSFILKLNPASPKPEIRDGLLFESGGEWIQTGVTSTKPITNSGPANHGMIRITVKRGSASVLPAIGSPIHLVSRHNSLLPEIKSASIPLWRKQIELKIKVNNHGIQMACPWNTAFVETSSDTAKNPDGLRQQLQKIFSFQGEYFDFLCSSVDGSADLFIPSSNLKQIRRSWAGTTEEAYWKKKQIHPHKAPIDYTPGEMPRIIPARKDLQVDGLPFYLPGTELKPWIERSEELGLEEVWIPVFPLTPGSKSDLEEIAAQTNSRKLILGINNPGAAWQSIKTAASNPGLRFFGDYGLYNSNSYSDRFYSSRIPSYLFSLPWLENPVEEHGNIKKSPMDLTGFTPPLFISRICLRRTFQHDSCGNCPYRITGADNQQTWETRLTQNKFSYRVVCKNCWTFVFQE